MKKIYELTAKADNVVFQGNKTKCVEVFAFAGDESGENVTIAYETMGDEQQMFVYDGEINVKDPGEGPMEEYKSREDAVASEYGNLFRTVFDLADSMK